MIYNLYSTFDSVAESFGAVTLDNSDATAKRNFAAAVSNSAQLQFIAKDLILYRVGEFDASNGVIVPCVPLVQICKGFEVMPHDD